MPTDTREPSNTPKVVVVAVALVVLAFLLGKRHEQPSRLEPPF